MIVLVKGGSRRRISYYSNCESRQTAFDAAETGKFPECCTKRCRDNSFTSVVPASTEYWIAVQSLTDESISEEMPHFTQISREIPLMLTAR